MKTIGLGILVVAVLALAWLFIAHIPRTLSIVLIGAFIAFGAEPTVTRLKKRMPKSVAIAIVFAGLAVLIVLGLVVVVPATVDQTKILGASLPIYVTALQNWLTSGQSWLQHEVPGLHVRPQSFDLGQIVSTHLDAFAATAVGSIQTIMTELASAFFVGFSAIVLSFLFLMNDTKICDGFVSLFPVIRRDAARKLSIEITEMFSKYISGQVTVSAITGLVIAGLSAIVGFKLPWILFIVTFIGYSIPMVGMLIAQVIAAVLCAPQGIWTILWVQAIMFVVARISDNVLVPKIMGQSVGMSPIWTMLAVFAGGELFGLPGLVLAIPFAALTKILWQYFGAPWYHAQLNRAA